MRLMYKSKIACRIISVCVVMCVLLSACVSISAKSLFDYTEANMVDSIGTGDKKYEQNFLRITGLNDYCTEAAGVYFYQPLYEYFSEDNENITENSVPDYVLIFAGQFLGGPAFCYGRYGDYVVRSGGYQVPYTLGYCVYIPEKGIVLDLGEAYDTNLDNIEAIFTDYNFGSLIGDTNNDRKLNVKDASTIQKCLAGIEKFSADDEILGGNESQGENVYYISDFNCDGNRDISDATAIQKRIAGLL